MPFDEASRKLPDPLPAACGCLQPAGPGVSAEPVRDHEEMAADRPQRLLQRHQLQDCSKPPFPWEHVLGHRQEMCLPQLSSRMNQLEHSHSVTSAVLEELSTKDVTVKNIFVTSGWQSGFSTKIRTDANAVDFLLSSPCPSKTSLEYAGGNLHFS